MSYNNSIHRRNGWSTVNRKYSLSVLSASNYRSTNTHHMDRDDLSALRSRHSCCCWCGLGANNHQLYSEYLAVDEGSTQVPGTPSTSVLATNCKSKAFICCAIRRWWHHSSDVYTIYYILYYIYAYISETWQKQDAAVPNRHSHCWRTSYLFNLCDSILMFFSLSWPCDFHRHGRYKTRRHFIHDNAALLYDDCRSLLDCKNLSIIMTWHTLYSYFAHHKPLPFQLHDPCRRFPRIEWQPGRQWCWTTDYHKHAYDQYWSPSIYDDDDGDTIISMSQGLLRQSIERHVGRFTEMLYHYRDWWR